jgi:AcrR family transcriptional regulator
MPPTKRESKSQKKKGKIVQTTMQLLLKKGSSSTTSTTDICTAARLTRPTLYHYFGSKRNLLLAVHMESLDSVLKPYLEEASSIEEPLKRLEFMIRRFTKDVCEHPELRVLIHDSLTIKDKYFREVRGVWKEHYVLLRDTIAQLRSTGRTNDSVRPSWAALFVLGMITWVTYWFDYDRKNQTNDLADQAVRLVVQGLGIKN